MGGAQNTTQKKVYVKDIILSVDNNELKGRCKHQLVVNLEVSEQENVEIDTYKGISDVSWIWMSAESYWLQPHCMIIVSPVGSLLDCKVSLHGSRLNVILWGTLASHWNIWPGTWRSQLRRRIEKITVQVQKPTALGFSRSSGVEITRKKIDFQVGCMLTYASMQLITSWSERWLMMNR